MRSPGPVPRAPIPRARRCDSICISVAIDDCSDCCVVARLSTYTMNAASASNATASTPRIWNCLTVGRLPMTASFDGGDAVLLAVRSCSITDIDVNASYPSGDVTPIRTWVVGASKSVFSAARGSPPNSLVIFKDMALPSSSRRGRTGLMRQPAETRDRAPACRDRFPARYLRRHPANAAHARPEPLPA